MASATDSTSNEPDLTLSWSGRWTLTHRILALNILTLLLVVLSTIYLDAFRHRLSKERTQQTRLETATAVDARSTPGMTFLTRPSAMSVSESDWFIACAPRDAVPRASGSSFALSAKTFTAWSIRSTVIAA